jgi:hypothetical protein
MTAFRNDGVTPVLPGTIFQCETIIYRGTLAWAGGNNAAIQGGTLTITTAGPDGIFGNADDVATNVTPAGGVPCLGGTDGVICDPTITSVNTNTVSYTAAIASCPATLTASIAYTNGLAHIGAADEPGVVSGSTALPIGVVCCAQDNTVCNGAEFCNPAKTYSIGGGTNNALGTCDAGTPLNCDDTNACTTDTCDSVLGCQHAPITCNDSNSCTTDTCSPATGCVFTPISCDDSNACTTDLCDPATGCTHTAISCDDSNACTTDTCSPATGCVHTAISCDDSNACTTDLCDPATGCTHTAISCDDSNACTTDTCDPATGCGHAPITCDDNNTCTDDTCDPATGCVYTPNGTCNVTEICRTPGFWGTHACPETDCTLAGSVCEKANSQNITQIVLNDFTGTCGPLLICGNDITDTCLDSSSAVEAICVAVKGDTRLQVARQLTAAALNCILSNSADATVGTCTGAGENCADPCAGVSVDAAFTACNAAANACASTATLPDGTVINCIDALDCFNNGGTFDPATGSCGASTTSCHDRDLVNGCFSFNPPGPAGSPKECNDARKDAITIFP